MTLCSSIELIRHQAQALSSEVLRLVRMFGQVPVNQVCAPFGITSSQLTFSR
jgi:hypothetical protein